MDVRYVLDGKSELRPPPFSKVTSLKIGYHKTGRASLVDFYRKGDGSPADFDPFKDVLDVTIPLAHDRFAQSTKEALDKFKDSHTLQSLLNLNIKSPGLCGIELSNRLATLRSMLFVNG